MVPIRHRTNLFSSAHPRCGKWRGRARESGPAGQGASTPAGDIVYGFDISTEYHVLHQTVINGIWHFPHPCAAYGALLAVTALGSVVPPSLGGSLAAGAMVVLAAVELIPEAFSHSFVGEAAVGLLAGVVLALGLLGGPA